MDSSALRVVVSRGNLGTQRISLIRFVSSFSFHRHSIDFSPSFYIFIINMLKRSLASPVTFVKEKRSRKVMTLAQKIEILNLLSEGVRASEAGRRYNVNESTIRTIKKTEEKIRSSVRASGDYSTKVTRISRDPTLEKVEKLLNIWIDRNTNDHKSNVDGVTIRAKAQELYAQECEKVGQSTYNFQASKGWLHRFLNRYNIHSLRGISKSAHSQTEVAEHYWPQFLDLVCEGGYLPEQVFNADETCLHFKKMGTRTFIDDEVNKQGFNDRLTVVICGNAAGDCKPKPILVYRCENPRSLSGKNKSHLPVYWRSNENAAMTGHIFEDWFHNCFAPEVKAYLGSKNLPFKALLVLDNVPAFCCNTYNLDHPNIAVTFLPTHTASILQPMEMGVIKTFKANYISKLFKKTVQAMESSDSFILIEFLKCYSICDCLEVIKEAWEDVTSSTVNACWNSLWPQVVKNFKGYPPINAEVQAILRFAQELGGEGFSDMTEDEVHELIDCTAEDVTMVELQQTTIEGQEESDEDLPEPQKNLTTYLIQEILHDADVLCNKICDSDPILERSLRIKRGIQDVLLPYREVLKHLSLNANTFE